MSAATDARDTAVAAAEQVPAAALVSAGLIGGYATARATGVRPLGGAVLAAAAALYVLGFGLSHPLARRIGAWPSVLAVTAVNAAANTVLVDRPGR